MKNLRFLENKSIPGWISVLLHVVVAYLLYSALTMTYALLSLHLDWGRTDATQGTPFFLGKLIPLSFYSTPSQASYGLLIMAVLVIPFTWAFSTRVKLFNNSVFRRLLSFALNWGTLLVIINFYLVRKIKYIGYDKIVGIHDTMNPIYRDSFHRGSLEILGYALMITPWIISVLYIAYLVGKYKEDKVLQEWFRTYKFEAGWIGRFGEEDINALPDIQLARNAENNAPVVLSGESRQVGTMLIGPPGSGKTSIKIKTAFRQDLGHIQRMINDYPKLVRKYGYGTKEYLEHMGKHLVGSIIIEPAKDLCDDAYELALEHNIPEEFIVYLNPSDPNTPGFNAMVGPVTQVVETITSVLESIAETKDEFFRQAARSVLKHYVFLLKFYKGDECTLLDLDDMYQDPRFVMDMVEAVEKTIPDEEYIHQLPQDERIHWMIIQKVIRWFRNEGVAIETDRDGMVRKYPKGDKHEGKPIVKDLQFEFTRQTRNLLADITRNRYLARVLYAENAVDLDRLMQKGGILLVNTDLGNLQQLSAAFGKLVLLCVQNAVFRRKGNEKTRPLVSMYADEFYDYMNKSFLQLTSQGRKYKFAPLVACQSLTQFGVLFGKDFTESMLGTIRNTIVYGGVSTYDAELLSKYLGQMEIEELSVRESVTPEQMKSPSYSYSETTQRKKVEMASADDIMFQEFKFSYIRMVQDKSSKRAIRAEGDFVDTSEAEQWKKALNPQAMKEFIEFWRQAAQEDEWQLTERTAEGNLERLRDELRQMEQEQTLIREESTQESTSTPVPSRFRSLQMAKLQRSDQTEQEVESQEAALLVVESSKKDHIQTDEIIQETPKESVQGKTKPSGTSLSFSQAFQSAAQQPQRTNANKNDIKDTDMVESESYQKLKQVSITDEGIAILKKINQKK